MIRPGDLENPEGSLDLIDRGGAGGVAPLADRQRAVLRVIARHFDATDEYPSVPYIARRLGLHHSTVQQHLNALYRKGWLRAPMPSAIRCWPGR